MEIFCLLFFGNSWFGKFIWNFYEKNVRGCELLKGIFKKILMENYKWRWTGLTKELLMSKVNSRFFSTKRVNSAPTNWQKTSINPLQKECRNAKYFWNVDKNWERHVAMCKKRSSAQSCKWTLFCSKYECQIFVRLIFTWQY